MTAEPDLLHCAECGMPCEPGEYHPFAACLMFKASRNSTVVRANLRSVQRHATAARDAEIEAMRAEVERANGWNERVSVCRDHVAEIVDGPCVICALDAAEARAERLAEASREWWASHRPVGWTEDQHRACPHVNLATDTGKALADALLREQGGGSGAFWGPFPKVGGPDWTGHD